MTSIFAAQAYFKSLPHEPQNPNRCPAFHFFVVCFLQRPKQNEKEDLKTELDTVSYSLGVNIGSNIKQQGVKNLNLNALMKGMEQALAGDSTWLNDQEAMSAIQGYFTKISEAKGAESKKAGEAFLAENGKKKASPPPLPVFNTKSSKWAMATNPWLLTKSPCITTVPPPMVRF